jgi:cytochrome c
VSLIETSGSFADITTVGNKLSSLPLAIALSLLAVGPAPAQSPAAGRGALLFQTCSACHNVLGDGVGPDLTGIYGQKAARNPNFAYSEALRSSNLVWDDTTLRAYIRNPQALVKGTKMAFPGYSDDADVEAVLSYLKTYR